MSGPDKTEYFGEGEKIEFFQNSFSIEVKGEVNPGDQPEAETDGEIDR